MAKRRLAAIVAADIAGYSRLMGVDEEGTLAALRSHRKALIDPLVRKHEGHLVKTTGDGLLLEFPSVVQAVACAVAIQRGMAERNTGVARDKRIEFRIGVNLGDVIVESGDVFGDGVNIAARLEQIAKPGDICISGDVYRQVEGKLDLRFADAGQPRLKNIDRPIRVYRIAVTATPAGFASALAMSLKDRRFWLSSVSLAAVAIIGAALIWFPAVMTLLGPRQERDTAVQTSDANTLPIIAILPFANQTGDKQRDYVADGFTEELIGALGRFSVLRVIGHNAVMPYRTGATSLVETASKLGAAYVVEGGLRGTGETLRISVRLTDARSATVLWSDQFEGPASDLLGFQIAISRRIAGTLAANITQLEGQRSLERPKPKQDAHDLVLQARALGYGGSRSENLRFRELLSKAIKIDPGYAAAHALMAEAIYARIALGWTEFADSEAEDGERFARQAIKLGPNEPDGYRALGRYHLLRAEYDQAQRELERAVEINPSDSSALGMWGAVRMFSGDINGAIEVLEQALKYDPALEPFYVFDLSLSYYFAYRHAEALRIAEQGVSQFEDFPNFHLSAAAAAAQLGQGQRASHHVQEIRKRLPFFNLDSFGTRFKNLAHLAYLKEGLQKAGL